LDLSLFFPSFRTLALLKMSGQTDGHTSCIAAFGIASGPGVVFPGLAIAPWTSSIVKGLLCWETEMALGLVRSHA
jgi:hypothetical protein